MDNLVPATVGQSTEQPGTAAGNEQTTEPVTPTTNVSPAPEQSPAPPRTYTEDQYQRMSTSQYAAGLAAAMREAGFEPTRGEDFKKQMAAFKQWQDSQKTDAEKQADTAKKSQDELAAERAKTTALERKLTALSKGVPADKIDRYTAIAATYMADDVDFESALGKALEDFPLPATTPIPKIVMGATGSSSTSTKDWKKMSLTERATLYREHPEEARALARQAGQALAE